MRGEEVVVFIPTEQRRNKQQYFCTLGQPLQWPLRKKQEKEFFVEDARKPPSRFIQSPYPQTWRACVSLFPLWKESLRLNQIKLVDSKRGKDNSAQLDKIKQYDGRKGWG